MRRHYAAALLISAIMLLGGCDLRAGPPTPTIAGHTEVGAGPAPSTAPALDPSDSVARDTAERVTITFAAWEEERPLYKPLIENFEKENPTIHVQFVTLDSLIPLVHFQGGTMQDADKSMREILSGADTAVVNLTAEAIQQGWVRDLRPLIDADAAFDRSDFYPDALKAIDHDRGVYMLPRNLNVSLLSYNKALWAARGLPPPDQDWSLQDLLAAAEQLAQKRGDTIEVYGFVDYHSDFIALQGLLDAAGVDLATTPPEQLRLDRPEIAAALDQVVALVQSGAIGLYGGEGGDIGQRIHDQQVGIWSTEMPSFFGYPASSLPFEIGTVRLPNSPIHVEGYSMSSGTQHPQEAWRWLSFLSRQPASWAFGDANVETQVPARPSIAEKSGFWKQVGVETSAAIKAVVSRPSGPPRPALDERLADLLYQALDAVLNGGKPARQALREAQTALGQLSLQATPAPTTGLITVATPVPQAAAGAVTIRFGAPGFDTEPIRQLARTFNQRNPTIFVDIIGTSTPSGPQSLSAIAAQTDCFTAFDSPTPDTLPDLLDLQPLIDADAAFNLADYPTALLQPFQSGAGLYGLPSEIYFRVLHYNPAAFDAAGLAYPAADWTLDDLQQVAQRLTGGTGATKRYGFALPGDVTGDQTSEIFFFLDRLGASATKGSGSTLAPNFTDPGVVAALRRYLVLLRAASPHTHLQGYRRDTESDDAAALIDRGQVGMWFFYGASFFGQLREFERAVAPPPLGNSGITANDFRVRGLYISAKTIQVEACWAWLKALSSDVAGVRWGFPARRSVAESDTFTDQAPAGAKEVYQAYRAAMERTPNTGDAVSPSLSESPFDLYWFYQAIDRGLQGKDLERELADAQRITEQYLSCVRGGAKGSVCAKQVDPEYQGWKNAVSSSN